MSHTVVSALLLLSAVAFAADDRHVAAEARAYRGDHPVLAQPDGLIVAEAEEFKVITPGWTAQPWGQNYYAATLANTFLSRKAFLGAPPDGPETTATITVNVPEAGRYLVLVRYEAAYRFETQFRVKVEQAGTTRLDRLYGARDNLKIWAFRQKLQKEVGWSWGAGENVVWEGRDAFADLEAGPTTISLIAAPQPGPQARRNVDVVLLTRDVEMVQQRIEKENYLPLDGLLTQSGDVWAKVTNAGSTPVAFSTKQMQEHSPYWVHLRTWKPIQIEVAPGQATDWIEVGGLLDTLNDGQWGLSFSGPCKLEVGLRNAAGEVEPARSFDASGDLTLVAWADMRYTRRIRRQQECAQELVTYLKGLPMHGRTPTQTLIFAFTKLAEFTDLFGLTDVTSGDTPVYVDWRGKTPQQLEEMCLKLTDAQRQAIRVVSLGDEIGLPRPDAATANEGFVAYLKAQGIKASDVDPAAGDDWSKLAYNLDPAIRDTQPGIFYWSRRYLHHYGIQNQKTLTDALRKHLPNAHVGANFSPHHGGAAHSYLGEVFQWVTCFRDDGMTLPWSEDYIWQVPVGSQQMNGINLDLFRAGLRGKQGRKIHYYVMPHYPGNTPASWRRMFHNALGHGMSIINLFEFHPVWLAYTENHVTSRDMYSTVLRTFREYGQYEDIVQAGQIPAAQVGLWFSETADIWDDNAGSFAAAKRALYTAILHQQAPLDFVVEQDALDGTLSQYKVLYLTDAHVSRAASAKIAAWASAGGVLFATAGAGMFDEYNQPNAVLRDLFGVSQTQLEQPEDSQVAFIKQDLPFAQPIATVQCLGDALPVFGALSRIERSSAQPLVDSDAVTTRQVGQGRAIYCTFLPSLSYYKPAIPLRPVDRGSTDDAMSHFLPTDFDPAAGELIGLPLDMAGVPRPITASVPLVETSLIRSDKGTVIVVNNWTPERRDGLRLTLDFPVDASSITLASGGELKVEKVEGKTVLTFDLNVSDVVILR